MAQFRYDIQIKCLVLQCGKLLLVRRAAHDSSPGYWEAPGGGLELGESPEVAATRELQEETGLQATVRRLFTVSGWSNGVSVQGIDVLYEMELTSEQPLRLSAEHDLSGWFEIDELDDLFMYDQARHVARAFLRAAA